MPSTILSDNGVSSGSAGLKTTAASDGALALQTTTAAGAATTAVTIGTDQSVTFAQAANLPNTFGFKNRLINGGMAIDQRNAGASVPMTSSSWGVDRYRCFANQTSKMTVQQTPSATETGFATRVNAGFTNYMAFTSLSAYSSLTGDRFFFYQGIEGTNTSDFALGTTNAKTFTISFWAYSSLTGTHSGCVQNNNTDRSYVFTYTISSANTWEYKTITIAGDQTGTWLTSSAGAGIYVSFNLGVGSTYLTSTTNAWQAGYYIGATGSQSIVGTNGATFYITGLQLERGSTATSFDFRSYGTELALCQRYYFAYAVPATCPQGFGAMQSTTAARIIFPNPVPMRATPTFTSLGSLGIASGGTSFIASASSVLGISSAGVQMQFDVSGATTHQTCVYRDSGGVTFSAEL